MLPQSIEDQVEELESRVKLLDEALIEERLKNARLKGALQSVAHALATNGVNISEAVEPYLKL
jgi:hypothetical protein